MLRYLYFILIVFISVFNTSLVFGESFGVKKDKRPNVVKLTKLIYEDFFLKQDSVVLKQLINEDTNFCSLAHGNSVSTCSEIKVKYFKYYTNTRDRFLRTNRNDIDNHLPILAIEKSDTSIDCILKFSDALHGKMSLIFSWLVLEDNYTLIDIRLFTKMTDIASNYHRRSGSSNHWKFFPLYFGAEQRGNYFLEYNLDTYKIINLESRRVTYESKERIKGLGYDVFTVEDSTLGMNRVIDFKGNSYGKSKVYVTSDATVNNGYVEVKTDIDEHDAFSVYHKVLFSSIDAPPPPPITRVNKKEGAPEMRMRNETAIDSEKQHQAFKKDTVKVLEVKKANGKFGYGIAAYIGGKEIGFDWIIPANYSHCNERSGYILYGDNYGEFNLYDIKNKVNVLENIYFISFHSISNNGNRTYWNIFNEELKRGLYCSETDERSDLYGIIGGTGSCFQAIEGNTKVILGPDLRAISRCEECSIVVIENEVLDKTNRYCCAIFDDGSYKILDKIE